MKTLTLLAGLPYSGKSSLLAEDPFDQRDDGFGDVVIVCPDDIRRALHGQRFAPYAEPHVWAIAETMVRGFLLSDQVQHVYFDSTMSTEKRRDPWRRLGLSAGGEVHLLVLDTNVELCKGRARKVGDEEIIPIIERQAEAWEEPAPENWELEGHEILRSTFRDLDTYRFSTWRAIK